MKELVIITASNTNECQFCENSHVDLVGIADIIENPLVAIEATESLAPRERLAVEYTRAAMADSNAIPESMVQQLHQEFTDPELVELSFLIGYINMLNLFNNLLQVRYHGDYAILAASPSA